MFLERKMVKVIICIHHNFSACSIQLVTSVPVESLPSTPPFPPLLPFLFPSNYNIKQFSSEHWPIESLREQSCERITRSFYGIIRLAGVIILSWQVLLEGDLSTIRQMSQMSQTPDPDSKIVSVLFYVRGLLYAMF